MHELGRLVPLGEVYLFSSLDVADSAMIGRLGSCLIQHKADDERRDQRQRRGVHRIHDNR